MKDAQDGTKQAIDVIPLFKSCYSKGKSILHIKKPKTEKGFSSICNIIEKNNLKKVLIVEDNMNGFLQSKKAIEKLGCNFSFGWRFDCQFEGDQFHKLVAIPLNKSGVLKLYKIYTNAFTKTNEKSQPKINGSLTSNEVNQYIDEDFILAIPFYDSFLYKNCMEFTSINFDISKFKNPILFLENNELPFDNMLRKKVMLFAKNNNIATQEAKSIYYENEDDFKAYQCFKIACNKVSNGKKVNISRPELPHCSSNKFSFESWKKIYS